MRSSGAHSGAPNFECAFESDWLMLIPPVIAHPPHGVGGSRATTCSTAQGREGSNQIQDEETSEEGSADRQEDTTRAGVETREESNSVLVEEGSEEQHMC